MGDGLTEAVSEMADLVISVEAFDWRLTMPGRGLEPLRISPPDPKSGASANFATLATRFRIVNFRFAIANEAGSPKW